jgi:hypothetical protein
VAGYVSGVVVSWSSSARGGEDPHGRSDQVGEVPVTGDECVGVGFERDQIVVIGVAADRGVVLLVVGGLRAVTELVDEVGDVLKGDVVPEPVSAQGSVEFLDQLGHVLRAARTDGTCQG